MVLTFHPDCLDNKMEYSNQKKIGETFHRTKLGLHGHWDISHQPGLELIIGRHERKRREEGLKAEACLTVRGPLRLWAGKGR